MYAILVEDMIAEKSSILDTLASDSVAAMILMLTHAEIWCTKQPVHLGYSVDQHNNGHCVSVSCGADVVLSITAQSIVGVISSAELKAFITPMKPTDIN